MPDDFKIATRMVATTLGVFVGIVLIKTAIESDLYSIPFEVKMPKNTIAFVVDMIPMIIGMIIGEKLKNSIRKLNKKLEKIYQKE